MTNAKGTCVIGVSGFVKFIEKKYTNGGVGFYYCRYCADG